MDRKELEQTVRRALGHAAKMIEEQERLRMLRDQLDNIKVGGGMGEGHGGGGYTETVYDWQNRRNAKRPAAALSFTKNTGVALSGLRERPEKNVKSCMVIS